MAAPLDVEFRLDETLSIRAIITGLDRVPVNIASLSGSDIKWGIARRQSGEPVAELDLDNGITKEDAPNGVILIQFNSADQDDIRPGSYWHECKVSTDEGDSVQFAGAARVLPSIFQEIPES